MHILQNDHQCLVNIYHHKYLQFLYETFSWSRFLVMRTSMIYSFSSFQIQYNIINYNIHFIKDQPPTDWRGRKGNILLPHNSLKSIAPAILREVKSLEVLIIHQWEGQELGLSLLIPALGPGASLWDTVLFVPSHSLGSHKNSPGPFSPVFELLLNPQVGARTWLKTAHNRLCWIQAPGSGERRPVWKQPVLLFASSSVHCLLLLRKHGLLVRINRNPSY